MPSLTVAKAAPMPGQDEVMSKRKILLVDDRPATRITIGDWLQSEGYEVLQARTGLEARSVLAEVVPDLVLLDIAVPDCVEGEDLSGVLRGTRQEGAELALIEYESPYWPETPAMAFRAIRTGRWLYSYFLTQGPTQLFDLGNDPYEMDNLIDHPDHEATRAELQAKLAAKLTDIGDDFLERAQVYQ